MGRSPIKPLKSMLRSKCEYVGFEKYVHTCSTLVKVQECFVGFEKYVHTVVKVQELNSAHANLESVPFSKLRYSYLGTTKYERDQNTST